MKKSRFLALFLSIVMAVSYTHLDVYKRQGSSCLEVTMVSGYSLVPEPPAKMIPFKIIPPFDMLIF